MDILVNNSTLNLSLNDVKQMIANERYFKYYKPLPVDSRIEDDKNHGVPMMNAVFYELFLRLSRVPHWQEFLDAYINMWGHTIYADGNDMTFKSPDPRFQYVFKRQALEKKLIRAYMSFLKEVYVLYWFYNRGLTTACYSLENDIAGYDITAVNRFNQMFGIKIYSDTYKANRFANIKKSERNRLPVNTTSIAIKANINKDNGMLLGDTYIFPDRLLNGVYHYINNNIQKDIIL